MTALADAQRRLAERVYQQVKDDLFEFRLPPGTRFSENELALRLGVSRTPVREALYRLQREGHLSVHAKSGWTVQPLDFQRFDQLYDVRVILELAAVRILCSRESGALLANLKRDWLVPARQRRRDWQQVAILDEAFHDTLISATGNPELSRAYQNVIEQLRVIRRLDFTQPERIATTYEEHGAILRAILARRTQQATLLLKAHIEHSKLEVRKITIHRVHLAHARPV